MTQYPSIIGILLAGGRGRRYGSNKLLANTGEGKPLGLKAAETLAAVVETMVVVRAGDETTRTLFEDAGYRVVICDNADLGMGASLAAGVRALNGADACLIALADMPSITADTIRAVCDRLAATDRIVRPRFEGRAGHPVGFPKRFFGELAVLVDDDGGRPVLARHSNDIDYVETDDPGVLRDVDVPTDLDESTGG